MLSYLLEGIGMAKNCVLSGVVIYIIWSGILMITKKRSIKELGSESKMKLLVELLLIICVWTILSITGIIGRTFSYDFSISALTSLLDVPFIGASIKMVTLNFLLFVPYGFLVRFAFPKPILNAGKVLLMGFCSSLFIELVQAFTGRLCELDDLIANTAGFFVGFLIAQAFVKIKSQNTRKQGILQIIFVTAITLIILFLLSFIANGDALQEKEDEYYNGIGNNEEEVDAICTVNIYSNGDVYDALNSEAGNWFTWYLGMGGSISNQSKRYVIESLSTSIDEIIENETGKTYMEIEYSEPQIFRFYNNHSWVMENVKYIVYCVEDGTVWYGSSKESVAYCARYESENIQYQMDEDLADEINNWLTNIK